MRFKAGTARLARIETGNETYRITTRDDAASLVASIETCGLINPPILLATDRGSHIIVCGFRRIDACGRMGRERIDARILEAGTAPGQCALVAIGDNCFQRELNLIETARALNLLTAVLPDDAAVMDAAGRLGLPAAATTLSKIRSLASLPIPLQRGLIEGALSLPMAERLQQMPAEEAMESYGLFREIRAGLNIQREILDNAEECALREGVSLREVLRSESLVAIRTSADLDRSRKIALVRKLLRKRRYPALTRAEKRFARYSGELGLRRDMKLVPPAGFEGPDYSLSLRFRSPGQLREQKEAIERMLAGDALRTILD